MNYFDGLEAFFAVAESLSFSKAAQKLRISQPAMSKRIQQLEIHLGMALLSRDRKRISLTERGKALLQQVKPQIRQLESTMASLQGQSQKLEGLIRIAALSGPFVDWCLAFQKISPAISFQFEFLDNQQTLEAVKAGNIDFGIVSAPPELQSVISERIFVEESILLTRAQNDRDPRTYSSKDPMPIVRFRFRSPLRTDRASLFRPFIEKFRRQLGIKAYTHHFAVNSFPGMIEVLLASDCFAVMPRHTVEEQLRAGILRRVGDCRLETDLFLIYQSHVMSEKKLQSFYEFLKQQFG